jgi:transposase
MLWTSPYKVGATDVYNRRLPQLDHDFLRQVEIRANSIMISTRTTYGSALLIYNVWCDSMLIDDAARIPTSTTIIISWVSAMTASYATKTISGYVDAIKTWHEIQGVPWRVTEDIVDRTIMGSAAFVPPESNREKREPYRPLHTTSTPNFLRYYETRVQRVATLIERAQVLNLVCAHPDLRVICIVPLDVVSIPLCTMVQHLSNPLCELIVRWKVYERIPVQEIARRVGCDLSTIHKIVKRFTTTGNPYTLPRGHAPETLTADNVRYLISLLLANPALFLNELQLCLYHARNVWVHQSTISRTLVRHGYSHKKLARQAAEHNALLRAVWIAKYSHIPAQCCVWLDESGVDKHDHFRVDGWSPVGVAPVRCDSFHRSLRLTMLPAMTTEGIIAMNVFDGGVGKEQFLGFFRDQVVRADTFGSLMACSHARCIVRSPYSTHIDWSTLFHAVLSFSTTARSCHVSAPL